MEYDSLARLRVYPDGEEVVYTYDRGGLLQRVVGTKRGNRYTYVSHVGYDEFSQRVRMVYGNEVESRYTYDPLTRRLASLTTRTPAGAVLQALTYQYDRVGNVLGSRNAPPIQRFGGITLGPVEQTYRYDSLYRLVEASGRFEFAPGKVNRYSNLLTYDPIHNLTAKVQTHTIDQPSGAPVEQKETTYALRFTYGGPQPHAATADGERTYQYDPSGNLVRWDDDRSGQRRQLLWTEENRLREVSDNGRTTTFRYNAAGERVVKRGRFGETVWINQFWTIRNAEVASKHVFAGESRVATQLVRQGGNPGRQPITRRPSDGRQATTTVVSEPVLVATAGTVPVPVGATTASPEAAPRLMATQTDVPAADSVSGRPGTPPGQAKKLEGAGGTPARGEGRPGWAGRHETRGIDRALEVGRGKKLGLQDRDGGGPGGNPDDGTNPGGQGRGRNSPAIEGPYRPQEFQLFFYHTDHLGSSNVITDAYAEVYEHVQYFPFGEPWVDQGGTATLLPYKFTSKELDPETGLYYYGARYYEPRLQRWLSPDPLLAGPYLSGQPNDGVYGPVNINPYRYAANNPIRLTDPTGLAEEDDEAIQDAMRVHRAQATAVKQTFEKIEPVARAAAELNPVIAGLEAATGESATTGEQLSKSERIGLSAGIFAGVLKFFHFGKAAAETTEIAARFASTPERAKVLGRVITAKGGLRTSNTVARQLADQRGFVPVQSILETVGSGARVPDPQGVAGQFLYRADASFNKSRGVLEVLVHEATGEIRHVLYRSLP